jgi:tryptophanyl-tRNA synthetase
VCHVQKHLQEKTIKEAFGYTESDSVGMFALPTVKAAATFASSFPGVFQDLTSDTLALVTCGLDQAPFFSLARDVAANVGQAAPAVLYSQFVPSM